MLQPGERMGDWIVEAPLAEGGMGAVYRVHNVLADTMKAALKVMKPHDLGSARARFAQELSALAALVHPGIVRVLGGGEANGTLYIVMELLEGETLAERLKRGPLPSAEAVAIFRSLALSLEFAHRRQIFHRDIKPANIALTPEPKLIDFGIARQADSSLTTTGVMVGTLAYLPPEVFREDQSDPQRADLYALGQTLYEALTGEQPFGDPSRTQPARLMARKLAAAALDPGPAFPEAVRAVLREATHPDPTQRLSSPRAFADGLGSERPPETVRARRPAETPPEPQQEGRPPDTVRQPRPVTRAEAPAQVSGQKGGYGLVAGLGGLVVVGGLVVGIGALFLAGVSDRSPPATPAAQPAVTSVAQPAVTPASSSYAMVRIPKGSFTMGVNGVESNEKPPHTVTISADFYLGKYEVTQGEWSAVMGRTPTAERCATYEGVSLVGDALPVVCVSWLDVVGFANKLSEKEGLTPAYTIAGESVTWNRSANGYRLPTEAEWEYAALAGTKLVYAGTSEVGDVCRYGNGLDPSSKEKFGFSWDAFPCEDGYATLAPVGKFLPNAWGLYDMTGNVGEWVWDWYDSSSYTSSAAVDPAGPSAAARYRVLRGGSWINRPTGTRIAFRGSGSPSSSPSGRSYIGFRLARSNP